MKLDRTAFQYYVAGKGYVGSYSQASIVVEGAPAFTLTYNAYLSK